MEYLFINFKENTNANEKEKVCLKKVAIGKQQVMYEIQIDANSYYTRQSTNWFKKYLHARKIKKINKKIENFIYDFMCKNEGKRISAVLSKSIYNNNEALSNITSILDEYEITITNYQGNIHENIVKYISKECKKHKLQNKSPILLTYSCEKEFNEKYLQYCIDKFSTVDLLFTDIQTIAYSRVLKSVERINIQEGSVIEAHNTLNKEQFLKYDIIVHMSKPSEQLTALKGLKQYEINLYINENDVYDYYVLTLKNSNENKNISQEQLRNIVNMYGRTNAAYVLCDMLNLIK